MGFIMVYAVITVTLIYMLSLLGSFIKKFICSDREGKLRLVKGYAKGRFVLIYVAAIPLFMLGALTNGDPFVKAFFAAVEASVDLVVLSYDYDISAALMAQNGYYLAVMIILFLLVVLNTAMFTLALCYQRGVNAVYLKKATERSEKVYVVVGKNVKNRDILTSCEGAKILIAEDNQKDNELEEFCYLNKIALVKIKNDLSLKDVLNNLFKDLTACSINVIINTGSDSENLLFTEDISELINSIDLQKLAIDDVRGVHAYVFGEPENASAFLHFVKKTSGQIRYVNKYKLVALDFVDKYPLTAFMGEDEIDYGTATLKPNVDLNVAMVGYNKTMQELFVTSVANNQFMSIDADGKLVARPVRYCLFTKRNDKAASVSDKNLNHTYFRYAFVRSDMEKSGKYLPLPELPAKESFIPLDINDADFYQQVKESLSPQVEGHSTYNYLIVSYASDLKNLDIAEKLYIKIKEWGIDKKTKLFVKIRDDKLANKIVKEEYNHLEGIITFATEKEVVYNLKQIVSENIETMARDRHLAYAVCDAIQDGNEENVVKTKA
ncbi:MAG: hypothetical protein J6V83_03315, partial [Clostridia bacterium]|nr:hypothetical protein [Clostridia bacterium]